MEESPKLERKNSKSKIQSLCSESAISQEFRSQFFIVFYELSPRSRTKFMDEPEKQMTCLKGFVSLLTKKLNDADFNTKMKGERDVHKKNRSINSKEVTHFCTAYIIACKLQNLVKETDVHHNTFVEHVRDLERYMNSNSFW